MSIEDEEIDSNDLLYRKMFYSIYSRIFPATSLGFFHPFNTPTKDEFDRPVIRQRIFTHDDSSSTVVFSR